MSPAVIGETQVPLSQQARDSPDRVANASNDGTAGGAIQALKEAGLAGKVAVTGQDADLVACQRILAGTQSMTVYKPVHHLARRAAELAPEDAAVRTNLGIVLARQGRFEDAAEVFAQVSTKYATVKQELDELVQARAAARRVEETVL